MLHISFGNGQREVSVRLDDCIPCNVGGNLTEAAAEVPPESSASSAEHAQSSEPLNEGHDERTATTGPVDSDKYECLDISNGKLLDSNSLLASDSVISSKLRAQEARIEPTSPKIPLKRRQPPMSRFLLGLSQMLIRQKLEKIMRSLIMWFHCLRSCQKELPLKVVNTLSAGHTKELIVMLEHSKV